jgi:CrcB protein
VTQILLVALGGALGAVARFLVGVLVARRLGLDWPWGTFFINVSGCFAIGLLLPLFGERHEAWRLLLPVGFVGAYTTFSTFEYETLRLIEAGAWKSVGSYVLGSNVAGFIAVALGAWLGRRI